MYRKLEQNLCKDLNSTRLCPRWGVGRSQRSCLPVANFYVVTWFIQRRITWNFTTMIKKHIISYYVNFQTIWIFFSKAMYFFTKIWEICLLWPSFWAITTLRRRFTEHVKTYSDSSWNFTSEYVKKVGARPLQRPELDPFMPQMRCRPFTAQLPACGQLLCHNLVHT